MDMMDMETLDMIDGFTYGGTITMATNKSTQPKRTADGTTSAETHLARLEELVDWMLGEQEDNVNIASAFREAHDVFRGSGYQEHADSLGCWAESLRWLIDREITRAIRDVTALSANDGDERSQAGRQWLDENRNIPRDALDRPAIDRERSRS